MRQTLAIARKELDSYFGSPMALIFVGVFLVVTLFTFFWADSFFARGIADVRPLFQWMPLLLIFLIAALTMRQWSEEQQTGTLEVLLTMPVKLTQLVLGKFLGVLILVSVALLVTVSLPITVTLLGRLDPGPVIGGYLATVLMAAAYIAIGLFVSSLSDNQIVSLIVTVIVCGLFYLVGSPTFTGIASANVAEIFRAIGTGSRFESIERGVIDLRDLVYYGSLSFIFLMLNILSLESKRWSAGSKTQLYRRNRRLTALLIVLNLVVFNVLFSQVNTARADLTQDGQYSLSPATRDVLSSLQEPLLIRGYFSQKTHPLLAPLIPRIRDTLQEYAIAAKGRLTVEFVDPITNPELEAEANQTYGIRSTPLQVTDRGGAALVNAYFNILIRYGDQNVVLGISDLIEVNQLGNTLDVHLRNLEYDLTSSLQRVVNGFQSLDAVLAALNQPAKLTLFVTPSTLPDTLKTAPDVITSVASNIKSHANGKFDFQMVDLSKTNVDLQALRAKYQIEPIATDFLASSTFYLHMLIEIGDKNQVIYPTSQVSETETRNNIEAALKRLAPGFLPTVGLWVPSNRSQNDPFGQQQPIQQYTTVSDALRKNYDVRSVNLSTGQVPDGINALVIIAPHNMTDLERYAVDQFLMRGGSIFVAAGNFQIASSPTGGLGLEPLTNGLQDLLTSYGIKVEQQLVLDTQNAPFPVQVNRNVNGVTVQDVQALNYPQFVDVRSNAMDHSSPIVASLPAVTMNWVSPITVDATQNAKRTVVTLFRSSPNSWATTDTTAEPNLDLYPETGFPVGATRSAYPLAVAVKGSFTSYFKGRPSPFASQATPGAPGPTPTPSQTSTEFVQQSPDSAQIIVVGSSEFLDDTVFGLLSRLGGQDRSQPNLQLVQNSVGWFVEDTALASIRSRGTSARLLAPLSQAEQSRWEVFNYVFALLAVVALGIIWQLRKRSEKPIPLLPMERPAEPPNMPPSPIHQGGA